jgi:hypothetical protein
MEIEVLTALLDCFALHSFAGEAKSFIEMNSWSVITDDFKFNTFDCMRSFKPR